MLICFLLPSFAFRADSLQGQEPHRILSNRFNEQYLLAQADHWLEFLNENPSWKARFDSHSGLPLRAWGKGISMGSSHSPQLQEQLLITLEVVEEE